MSKKKQKYYVVWEGVTPGIYKSWADCQLQIKGYPGARYKSFSSKEEAEEAYQGGPIVVKKKPKKSSPSVLPEYIKDSISVDAACSGNPGIMEYRGVHTHDKTEIFRVGPFKLGTNNIGEFLAIVHGLALLKKKGDEKTTIYTDSRTALVWIRNKKVKTTLVKNRKTADLYKLMERAENWLKKNSYKNPLVKWPTKEWGEIPADFGRK